MLNLLKDLTWLILEKKEIYKIEIFRSSSEKEVKLPSRAIDAMIEFEDCSFKSYWNEEEKAYVIITGNGEVQMTKDKWVFLLKIKGLVKIFTFTFQDCIDN